VANFTPRQLCPQEKSPRYPLYKLDGLQNRSGLGDEKYSPPLPAEGMKPTPKTLKFFDSREAPGPVCCPAMSRHRVTGGLRARLELCCTLFPVLKHFTFHTFQWSVSSLVFRERCLGTGTCSTTSYNSGIPS